MGRSWSAIEEILSTIILLIAVPFIIAFRLLVILLVFALIASPLILIGFIVWRLTT